jgi:hypothetical protein
MLGLLDLLKAVRGSATVALRRVHPLTGPALFAMLWVLALGSFFWMAGRDDSPDDEASPGVAHTEDSTTATTGVSHRGDGTPTAEEGSATTTSLPPGAVPGQISEAEPRMGQDADAPPTTTAADNQNRPSYSTTPATTSSTTSTTTPRGSSTTTTTAPPGLLGSLLDALGLG